MQIRAVGHDEADQFLAVFCAAFDIGVEAASPLFYADPFYELAHKRVSLDDEDHIVSCLTIIPSDMRIGNAIIPVGGIAGVSTLPTHRRRGYAGALLTSTMRVMADDMGFPMSCLFPERPEYYSQFGYAFASTMLHWSGGRDAARQASESIAGDNGGAVRSADLTDPADVAAISRIYEDQTTGRTGSCVRGKRRWKVIHHILSGGSTALFDERNQGVTGYMQFEPTRQKGRVMINEMYAQTDAAAKGLLSFVASWDAVTEIEWMASPRDLDRFGLTTDAMELPDAMLRITDLRHYLALSHPVDFAALLAETGETLSIRAVDREIRRNEVPVRLTAGGIEDAADADLAGPIGVITQILAGFVTPSEAVAAGLLDVSNPRALAMADRLFPPRSPFVPTLDHF